MIKRWYLTYASSLVVGTLISDEGLISPERAACELVVFPPGSSATNASTPGVTKRVFYSIDNRVAFSTSSTLTTSTYYLFNVALADVDNGANFRTFAANHLLLAHGTGEFPKAPDLTVTAPVLSTDISSTTSATVGTAITLTAKTSYPVIYTWEASTSKDFTDDQTVSLAGSGTLNDTITYSGGSTSSLVLTFSDSSTEYIYYRCVLSATYGDINTYSTVCTVTIS